MPKPSRMLRFIERLKVRMNEAKGKDNISNMNRLFSNRQQGRLCDNNSFHIGSFYAAMTRVRSYAHRIRRMLLSETSQSYWTRYNVTLHRSFKTAEESLAHLRWRNDQYIDYVKLMPVDGQDGKIVLDYGCGPGNDLIGFGIHSKPSRLIGVDVSPNHSNRHNRG